MLEDTAVGIGLLFAAFFAFVIAVEVKREWLTYIGVGLAFVLALAGMRFLALPG